MNLVERCEYLEEENRQLHAALKGSDSIHFPREWRLNAAERRVVRSLASSPSGFRSHEALFKVAAVREDVGHTLLGVVISRARKKLKPYGIEIQTVWGEGYKLYPESKEAVLRACSEVAA
jgi:two-component system cell cycle response regulator CtrA